MRSAPEGPGSTRAQQAPSPCRGGRPGSMTNSNASTRPVRTASSAASSRTRTRKSLRLSVPTFSPWWNHAISEHASRPTRRITNPPRPEERNQGFRFARGTRLPDDPPAIIDNADGRLFQRHAQSGKILHDCSSSMLVVNAYRTTLPHRERSSHLDHPGETPITLSVCRLGGPPRRLRPRPCVHAPFRGNPLPPDAGRHR